MHIGVIASMKKGLEHFVYRELLAFSRNGVSISLFPTKYNTGLYNPEKDWPVYRWNPLPVLLNQAFFFAGAPWKYLRLLKAALETNALVDFALAWHFARKMKDIDAIYSTFGDHKLFIGYFCKEILEKPLVVTIHAYELYQNPNPRLFSLALSACDRIVTVTEYNREILQEHFGIPPEKIEVVRINVDVEDYRPEKKFTILIVAFFVERKGHEVLFRALRELIEKDIEVWVVGDEGPEEGIDVRKMAKEIGVDSRVSFFGNLGGNALKSLYRACDVFCLPCRKDSLGVCEGFPTVLAEAMAFGKPIITTKHVEIPRIIKEMVVEENDIEGLVESIRKVHDSRELRHRLGEENRRIAVEIFSTKNAERTVELFQKLNGVARSGR